MEANNERIEMALEEGTTLLCFRFLLPQSRSEPEREFQPIWGCCLASDGLKSVLKADDMVVLQYRITKEKEKQEILKERKAAEKANDIEGALKLKEKEDLFMKQIIQGYFTSDPPLLTTPFNGHDGCKLLKASFDDYELIVGFGGRLIARDLLSEIFQNESDQRIRKAPPTWKSALQDISEQIGMLEKLKMQEAQEYYKKFKEKQEVTLEDMADWIKGNHLVRNICVLIPRISPSSSKDKESTLTVPNTKSRGESSSPDAKTSRAKSPSPDRRFSTELEKIKLPVKRGTLFVPHELTSALEENKKSYRPTIFAIRTIQESRGKFAVDILPNDQDILTMGNGELEAKNSIEWDIATAKRALTERLPEKERLAECMTKAEVIPIFEKAMKEAAKINPSRDHKTSNEEVHLLYVDNGSEPELSVVSFKVIEDRPPHTEPWLEISY